MQLFLKTLRNETQVISVPEDATVADLKNAVEDVEFIPQAQFRLTTGTAQLEGDALLLAALGIEEESTIDLQLRVVAGMRAKWRKKRMRRLRRKRRRMRQRAK